MVLVLQSLWSSEDDLRERQGAPHLNFSAVLILAALLLLLLTTGNS